MAYTVDIDEGAIATGRRMTEAYAGHICYVVNDSVAFLAGWDVEERDRIDLRAQMGDTSGNTQYSYSARGELVQETLPGSLILTRTYDARGSRTVLVNPDSGRQTYTYDQLGRSRTIMDTDGKVTTTSYDPAGQRTGLQDASGATRTYAFDVAGRLTQQVEANASGTPITTFTDSWDGVGNRLSRNHDGVVTTWTYDNAYRLTGQQAASANATFVYDAAGNILTKAQDGSSPMTMTYDAGNRLQNVTQGAGVTTVAYDANGNLSTETLGAAVTTYQYDPENHLSGIVNPDATRSTYTYSATGLRRTAQEPGGTQTLVVWDGDDYLQERAASTVLYVVQDAEILAEKRSGSRNWYVPDPLGSTSLLLDSSLNVTDTFEYWPYGEERTHAGSSVTSFRYVGTLGYYRDAAGRLYVRARVLRPDYGRWLTEDQLGGWLLFGYGLGCPVVYVDDTGLWPTKPGQRRALPPVDPGDQRGGCSIWKWIYTGDACAPDNVYQAALQGGADALMCMEDCIADVNKQLAALVVSVVGTVPAWGSPKTAKECLRGGRIDSSVARRLSLWIQRRFDPRISRMLRPWRFALWIKQNPYLRAGQLYLLMLLYAEAAISAYCAHVCMDNSRYVDD